MSVHIFNVTILHEFPGYGECTIGPWEGNISADDRYVAATSQNEKNASVYDIKNDKILGTKYFPSIIIEQKYFFLSLMAPVQSNFLDIPEQMRLIMRLRQKDLLALMEIKLFSHQTGILEDQEVVLL